MKFSLFAFTAMLAVLTAAVPQPEGLELEAR